MGPLKLTTARPISAPYSSCNFRSDSGLPSNPLRFASTTTGRLPLAAFKARATLRELWGKSVPPVHELGPSIGTGPRLGIGCDSIPINTTG